MKTNGKYLAWSIIHLILFIYMIFYDFGYNNFSGGFVLIILTMFFGWRFIENMKVAFK